MQALANPQGHKLVYAKALEGVECFQTSFTGFGPTVADHEIRIENKKVGAGVRITGDRPMSRFGYWSIRTVMSSPRMNRSCSRKSDGSTCRSRIQSRAFIRGSCELTRAAKHVPCAGDGIVEGQLPC